MNTMPLPNKQHMKHQQAGFSLIELMIAMTLSLVVLLAIIQVFLGSRQTYVLSDDLSRIQENGRFAVDFLAQGVRLAGYSPGGQDTPLPFLTTACLGFDSCTSEGGGNTSDRIGVILNPPPDDGTDSDCTGAGVGNNDMIANVYFIADLDNDNINSLYCQGFNITNGGQNSDAQPLIDGIDRLQVLYGVDTSGADAGVSGYVNATDLNAGAGATWADVKAVQLGLLVSSGSAEGSGDNMARTYQVLDADPWTPQAENPDPDGEDKHLRQIYTATVTLNNRIGTGG